MRVERDERKAAAIERSKRRQADQKYFNEKKLANVQPEVGLQVVQACTRGETNLNTLMSTDFLCFAD